MKEKLSGEFIRHLEITLSPGESFFAQRGTVIYFDSGITREVCFNGSGLRRVVGAKMSGESLLILRFTNKATTEKKLVLTSDRGLLPLNLEDETILCPNGCYIASDRMVNIDTKVSMKALKGGMSMFMQKIGGPAKVYLYTVDNPIELVLKEGEKIDVDETHIIAFRQLNERQLTPKWSAKNVMAGEGVSMLEVAGPGTIYMSPGRYFTGTSVNKSIGGIARGGIGMIIGIGVS